MRVAGGLFEAAQSFHVHLLALDLGLEDGGEAAFAVEVFADHAEDACVGSFGVPLVEQVLPRDVVLLLPLPDQGHELLPDFVTYIHLLAECIFVLPDEAEQQFAHVLGDVLRGFLVPFALGRGGAGLARIGQLVGG